MKMLLATRNVLLVEILACLGIIWLGKSTTFAQLECQDAHSSCLYWYLLDYCTNPAYASAMFESCRKTCGHCDAVSGRRAIWRQRVSAVCKDTIGSCQVYKSYGYCDSYKDYMRRYCTKTCGHCTVAPTTAPPSGTCKDDNTKCPTWKQYCVKTSVYWPYMSKNCKKTCKICTDGGSGGGGGGGGGSNGKKEFKCSFEGNLCDWSNQPLDDAVDWAVGTVSGGPSSGADGTSSYAYVDTSNSGYKARLRMPWELVLPSSRTYIGSMCLHFRFMTGNGSLKFIEVIYPTLNNKNPRPQDKGTFSGSGSWVNGKVQVQVDNKRMLVIEGNPGSSGKVVLDEIAFVKGRC